MMELTFIVFAVLGVILSLYGEKRKNAVMQTIGYLCFIATGIFSCYLFSLILVL